MSKEYKLSNGDLTCSDGFSQLYPDRVAELQRQREIKRSHKESEPDRKQVLDREEAAKFLRISMSTLDRYTKSGLIPYIKLKGRVLFNKDSLKDWLEQKEIIPKDDSDDNIYLMLMRFASRKELRDLLQKIERSEKVSNLLDTITKQHQSEEWEKMSNPQRDEIKQMERKLWSERLYLLRAYDEFESEMSARFRRKLGIPTPEDNKDER